MNSSQLSLQTQAAIELQARRNARKSLIEFTRYTNDLYQPASHHYLIAEKLEAVANGHIKRLMICMPPRHGKSELGNRRFPAWYVGKFPRNQLIVASYNSDIATEFGREVRNIVASDEYQCLFDVRLAADSQAANRWHTDQKGIYVAAGVGGGITGKGAHVLIIDDPFKDQAEADSELKRESVWNWYTSAAYTRLMPNGAVIIINTRWHEDDLSGRLLEQMANGGDQWEVLSLPAISEEGQALWPEWYPIERLKEIKTVLPARQWNSLYQQQPIPDDGSFFKNEWFVEYDDVPQGLTFYGASDYGVTDEGGDFTDHGIFGSEANKNIFVVDWWRGQTTADIWIDAKCDLIIKWKPATWFGESGPIRRSVEPFMVQRMTQRNAYCYIEWLASISDKMTRARPIQALASMGKIFIPKHSSWRTDVITQLLRFPVGKHDDAVDVFSLIGRGLEHVNVIKPTQQREPVYSSPRSFWG